MKNASSTKGLVMDLSVREDGFDFSSSIAEAMTSAGAEIAALNETADSIKALTPNCDKIDYGLAASSGVLCGIIDIFLVGEPGDSPLGIVTDQWVATKVVAFAESCQPGKRHFESLDAALRFLEQKFKVPYDQTGVGGFLKEKLRLTPGNHHFKSLAHNPSILGLFFSILDQFENTSHFISNGQLISLQQADEHWELRGANITSKLFCGFANWIGHLLSDVAGSSGSAARGNRGMGLPSPFWTWTNDLLAIKAILKDKLNLGEDEVGQRMNDLALSIFEKGYDARFQATQAIPVIVNDLLTRFMYAVRRLFNYFSTTSKDVRSFPLMWKHCEPFSNASVKRMLTVSHGTFCLLDVGEASVRAHATGGFSAEEFVLRLNIIGVGRFSISLYGEARRAAFVSLAKSEAEFAAKNSVIVSDYLEGLKFLAQEYDDSHLLSFVDDFKQGNYMSGFSKSVTLAKMRHVSPDESVQNKSDIDQYFRRRTDD